MVEGNEDEGRVLVSIPVSKRRAVATLTLGGSALLTGIGYAILSLLTPIGYDRFTGTDAASLERSLRMEVERVEVRVMRNEKAIKDHEDDALKWKERILQNETHVHRGDNQWKN